MLLRVVDNGDILEEEHHDEVILNFRVHKNNVVEDTCADMPGVEPEEKRNTTEVRRQKPNPAVAQAMTFSVLYFSCPPC